MYEVIIDEEKIDINDDPIPAECHVTKEYDAFKQMRGNRPVNERHVRNLMESMKRENLLKWHTILVNENYEIADGQHRFEAAKRLGLYIHYKVKVGASYKTAGILNYATEEWNFSNHLDNFAENGHQDYIKLRDFIDKNNVSLKRFRYLISEEQKTIFDQSFRTGEFRLIDNLQDISKKIESINSIIKYLDEILLIESKSFLKTDNFWRALYILLVKNDIDIEKFLEKLTVKRQAIRHLPSYKSYLELLTEIYNWKTKKARVSIKELN